MNDTVDKHHRIGIILPPKFLIPIALAGIVVIVISVVFEYRSWHRDFLQLLENQASLFVQTVANNAETVLEATDELDTEIRYRLISNLNLIAELDFVVPQTQRSLQTILQYTRFDELLLYNSEGKLISRVSVDEHRKKWIPEDMIQVVATGEMHELLLMIADTLDQNSIHIAAMLSRKRGGVVAGIIKAEQLQSFRSLFGLGRFLQQFQIGDGVEYIVLQNRETILAGKFGRFTMSGFQEDPFLTGAVTENKVSSRVLEYDGAAVFEAVAPFGSDDEPVGILRLGLSMHMFEELRGRVQWRIILFGGVLLVLGLVFLNFIWSYRHRGFLQQDLEWLQTYTNTILENLGSGVIAIGHDGNIQVANRQASLILNSDFSQLYDQPYTILPEPFHETIQKCISVGQHSVDRFTSEIDSKRLSVKSTSLPQGYGGDTCILLIDDVTKQARLEQQIQRQETLTVMGKLASTVAHEIRNPLNSISLIVQLLQKKYLPAVNTDQYLEKVATVLREIKRINTIVDEFIQFSRPPALRKMPVEFPDFFHEIRTLFQPRMEEAGITCQVEADPHPPFQGDHEKLKQVMINLIENAIQAIDPPGEIMIAGKERQDFYEISVADSGRGIPETDRKRIFDLYFTTKSKGSGIGLAVVHQIISSHNGTIEVHKREEGGTVLILRLPYKENYRTA